MCEVLKMTRLLFNALALLCLCFAENLKCLERDYGNGGTVCVCNDSYCDTIEPLAPFPDDEYNLYFSTRSGLRFHNLKNKFQNQYKRNVFQIEVKPKESYQKIYGFGGAFTDATSLNIKSLNPGAQRNLLASYFSPSGIEYNFGRVPIGGTDFSTHKYSLDDVPKDDTLQEFQLSKEDIDLKIPLIIESRRLSRKGIHLIGSAWSPPPWMKTNNDYTCFGLLKSEYYDLWAKYHVRFLEEYERRGLTFWALTTGNEPTAGLLPHYSFNCLGWTPFAQSKWIAENLGPQLANSRFNATKIIGIDDQRFLMPWWPKLMFRNEKTKNFVDGFGIHWYWDQFIPPQLLDLTHFAFPDKFLLYTEACVVKGTPVVALGSWKRGEQYAANIMNNINHYVGGWIDWNMALDLKGGPNWVDNVADAPVIVNASAGEFYKQPMYYALGHFSKFVPQGSVRISLTHTGSGIETVGFRTPENNIVLVLLNRKTKPISVLVRSLPKKTAFFKMPEKSIATLIYKNVEQ